MSSVKEFKDAIAAKNLKLELKIQADANLREAQKRLKDAEVVVIMDIGLGAYADIPLKNAEQRGALIAKETKSIREEVAKASDVVNKILIELEQLSNVVTAAKYQIKADQLSDERDNALKAIENELKVLKLKEEIADKQYDNLVTAHRYKMAEIKATKTSGK